MEPIDLQSIRVKITENQHSRGNIPDKTKEFYAFAHDHIEDNLPSGRESFFANILATYSSLEHIHIPASQTFGLENCHDFCDQSYKGDT
jgi:hypothetical protein